MRILNIIDLVGQTLLLGGALVVAVGMVVIGDAEAATLMLFFGAMYLGPWQMVSSVITLIARGLYFRLRLIHFVSALAYLGVLAGAAGLLSSIDPSGALGYTLAVVAYIIPGGLAVFYYYITYMTFKAARERSRALI